MCFSGEMSLFFTLCGLGMSSYLYFVVKAKTLGKCVLFFTSMELLQAVQYVTIAPYLGSLECKNIINQVLTTAGMLHICIQPFVVNTMQEYHMQSPKSINLFKERFVPEHKFSKNFQNVSIRKNLIFEKRFWVYFLCFYIIR